MWTITWTILYKEPEMFIPDYSEKSIYMGNWIILYLLVIGDYPFCC